MEKEQDHSYITSEVMTDVINRPASWLLNLTYSFFLFLVLSIVFCAYFIRYPDRISSRIVISSENPPAPVVSRVDGSLEKFFVSDRDTVFQGDILAVIQSSASYKDVLWVDSLLPSITTSVIGSFKELPEEPLVLGSLEESYALFKKNHEKFLYFLNHNPYKRKINAIKDHRLSMVKFISDKERVASLLLAKLEVASSEFNRSKYLFEGKVISESDFSNARQLYLDQQRDHELMLSEVQGLNVELSALSQQMSNLYIEMQNDSVSMHEDMFFSLSALSSALQVWKEKYLLSATQSGVVTFFNQWHQQQYVHTQEEVFRILPVDQQALIGKMSVSMNNTSDLNIADKVNIYLDNYSYTKYGKLGGSVERVALAPFHDKYVVTISFPYDKLVTDTGISIALQQQMQGDAEIITKDYRLYQRFIMRFNELADKVNM